MSLLTDVRNLFDEINKYPSRISQATHQINDFANNSAKLCVGNNEANLANVWDGILLVISDDSVQ